MTDYTETIEVETVTLADSIPSTTQGIQEVETVTLANEITPPTRGRQRRIMKV
ncbi:MAG: hypothetical protein GF411_20120 [Candidatus Lokiarchaeota archaeon]|nr:hypothetical protein [Candidatus Lokiarchaeota archaeon]